MKRRTFTALFMVLFSVFSVLNAQSFKQGDKLSWTTSANSGEFKVTWKSGSRFSLEQTNYDNPGAGKVKMSGEYRGGRYYISNSSYGEEWVGTERNGVISGKINNEYSFKISKISGYSNNNNYGSTSSYNTQKIFTSGKKMYWKTNGDAGEIKVTWVSGNKFNLSQTNYNNTSAGSVSLSGEYRNGKYYISNSSYGEEWVGTGSNGVITGKINNSIGFTISSSKPSGYNNNNNSYNNSYSQSFFKNGKKLYWKSSQGNYGEMSVTWASGTRFNITQKDYTNKSDGSATMTGELKGNTYYISCSKYGEKWVGTERNGVITGKIDNKLTFTISTKSLGNSNNSNSNNNSYNNNSSSSSKSIMTKGKRFNWRGTGGSGVIIVKSVSGNNFVIQQQNDRNPDAGWVEMRGDYSYGVYTVHNTQWNETWSLRLSNGSLKGKINNSSEIVLTPTSSNATNNANSASPGHRPTNNSNSYNNSSSIGDDMVR